MNELKRAKKAMRFPHNTCAVSRHALTIGEALMKGKPYAMLTEDPAYCGESIVAVVANLWEARNRIAELEAENALLAGYAGLYKLLLSGVGKPEPWPEEMR